MKDRIKVVHDTCGDYQLIKVSKTGMRNLERLADDTGISSSVYYLSYDSFCTFAAVALNVHCLYSWEGLEPRDLIRKALEACEPSLVGAGIDWRARVWTERGYNASVLLVEDGRLSEAPQLASIEEARAMVLHADAHASTFDRFADDVAGIFACTALARVTGIKIESWESGLQVVGKPKLYASGRIDRVYGRNDILHGLGLEGLTYHTMTVNRQLDIADLLTEEASA